MGAPSIAAAERRLVRRLRRAGASSPGSAQPLLELRRLQTRQLERLTDVGAIREAAPGRYYVDDEAYAAYRGDRRAVVFGVVIAAVGAALALELF